MQWSTNENSICELCGNMDYVLSVVWLQANYGSKHDGKRVKLCICGNCMDRLFSKFKIYEMR